MFGLNKKAIVFQALGRQIVRLWERGGRIMRRSSDDCDLEDALVFTLQGLNGLVLVVGCISI